MTSFPSSVAGRPQTSPLPPEQVLFLGSLALLAVAAALAPYDEVLLLGAYGRTGTQTVRFWQLMSALGSSAVLTPLIAAACLFRIWHRQGAAAVWLALGWVVTSLTADWMKWVVDRSRPPVPPLVSFEGASFPSGHAAQSCYVFLYLWLALASGFSSARGRLRKTLHIVGLAVLAFVPAAVGYSRAVLGTHWPTDILAGWALGAFFCGLVRLLQAPVALSASPETDTSKP